MLGKIAQATSAEEPGAVVVQERSVANIATLACGTVLAYESAGFVPAAGEVVPCRHHGYCEVVRRHADHRVGRPEAIGAQRRRTQGELMEHLHRRPVTTVHALRRHGFTLRLVVEAQKAGLLDVDLLGGRVVLGAVERSRRDRS